MTTSDRIPLNTYDTSLAVEYSTISFRSVVYWVQFSVSPRIGQWSTGVIFYLSVVCVRELHSLLSTPGSFFDIFLLKSQKFNKMSFKLRRSLDIALTRQMNWAATEFIRCGTNLASGQLRASFRAARGINCEWLLLDWTFCPFWSVQGNMHKWNRLTGQEDFETQNLLKKPRVPPSRAVWLSMQDEAKKIAIYATFAAEEWKMTVVTRAWIRFSRVHSAFWSKSFALGQNRETDGPNACLERH